ncbi:MAG TPA: efflux transporter outer membrane subunit, partial [Pyrinomonadaceae bacterium]|nr:efflux transporter outer membrane subunit [Pyrinomonadaceae bacterium]
PLQEFPHFESFRRFCVGTLLLMCLTQTYVVAQKYRRPPVQTPGTFRGDPSTQPDPQTIANLKWFELFQDEKLQKLIHDALANNYDLLEAVARVDAARANLGITRSEQFPTIIASSDVVNQRQSRSSGFDLPEPIKRDRSFGSALLNLLTYEIDIWGRLRKQTAAARFDLLATEEARKAVITTLVSDVATAYFGLRELDFELEISRRTLTSREESLRLIQLRQQRGIATMLEVRQAEELVYDAREVIPALEQGVQQTENFLSYLTGRNPSGIERGLSLTEHQLPPTVPAGLPSDLIERRPDIRAAENSLIAANARIGVAKAEFFPRISLTSFLGYESGQLTSLFSGSRNVWTLAGQVTQPIFTGGRLKSNVRFTQAQRDFLLVDYQKTIQSAFREVSDALIAYQKVKEVRTQRALLVETLRDRSRLSYLRYTGGVATLLDALDADRELFEAERSLAIARRDELLSVVQLYKALGGGWQ